MKGPDEVKKILDKQNVPSLSKTQLQPSSTKPSSLAQKVDLKNSENKSVESNNDEATKEFQNPAIEKLLDLLSTKTKTSSHSKKMNKKASSINI